MKLSARVLLRNELLGGLVIMAIFFLLVLTSCASNEALTHSILSKHTVATSLTAADNLNSKLIQKNSGFPQNVSSSDYRIGPEDLLDINVFQADELKTQVRVSANGYIKIKLADVIKAEGLTVVELEDAIAGRLKKFMNDPIVSVFIKEYRGQQISVLGSVKNPQVYFVTGQKYLIDMLSIAGGLSQDAGNICIVQTAGSKPDERIKVIVDLDALLMDGRADLNIPIRSGDVIQVPKSGVFYVDGAVRSPGEFPIKTATTVTQAISMAKGFDFTAVHSDIKIFRDSGRPEREVITTDYDDILAGKVQDIQLKDKDIIIVAQSGFRTFIKAFTGISFYGPGTGLSMKPAP